MDRSASKRDKVFEKVLDKFPALKRETKLKKHFTEVIPLLGKVEKSIALQAQTFDPGIVGYVEYATESGGKRIRPALVMLSAKALGKVKDTHIDLAVVVELIHLASLIHDDIMDQALIRRNKSTMSQKWGSEISVLVGDSLLAHSFKICARFPDMEICRRVADAANDVCTGEILQTQRRYDLKLSVKEYLRIVQMKTGSLFSLACEMAALLSGASKDVQKGLSIYGGCLGTAYQIYDDCLDLFGKEETFGKTLGTDLARGKLTLPILRMYEQLQEKDSEQISEIILNGKEDEFELVLKKIVETGGHLYSVRKAHDLLEKAKRALDSLDANGYVQTLKMLPESLQQDLNALKCKG
ncbi:MAG: polyprenyl synthetase family protein [Verrucomicrobiota bacterium]